jgi:hypothetical protein
VIRHQHRQPVGHRFQHRHRQTLAETRKNEGIGLAQQRVFGIAEGRAKE